MNRSAKKIRRIVRRNPTARKLARRLYGAVRPERAGGGPAPLEPFESFLPTGRRTVVLLCRPEQRKLVGRWLRQFPQDEVYLLAPDTAPEWLEGSGRPAHRKTEDLAQQARQLRRIGPVDVLVDLQPGSVAEHEATWRRLFFHVAPRGAYVVDLEPLVDDDVRGAVADWVQRMSVDRSKARRGDGSYVDAVSGAALSRDLLVFGKRYLHLLKLRNDEVDAVLTAREPGIRVTRLATLPAGELESRAQTISHQADVPIQWLPDRMPYPMLYLRHYEGPITVAGHTLAFTETAILPESSRWHHSQNPINPLVRSDSPSFGRLKPGAEAQATLEGSYYMLDPQYKNHFGHFLTESIGRLWGWDRAKEAVPDLKLLYATRNSDKSLTGFERRLIEAYGVAADDIVTIEHSVRVSSLVSATAMWHNAEPHYVHPGLKEVWERISANLVQPDGPRYDKVFVSRTERWSRRPCRNVPQIEELFVRHGFTVVYPEHLDLAEQASIFANSRVIAGFGGSAMMNLMHAKRLEVLIVLSHEAYTARNEHLYAALVGGTVHYFWSPSDLQHPEGGWSQEAFDSGWEFDFARNGRDIEELLGSL